MMPKTALPAIVKVRRYMKEFPDEFQLSPTNELFCKTCEVPVNCDRRSSVLKHRDTARHTKISAQSSSASQLFLSCATGIHKDFTNKVVSAFLSANIPLYKVNNEKLRALFSDIGHPLPSLTTCRSRVKLLADSELRRIKDIVADKKVYIVIDESEISGKQYFNTLVGNIEEPDKIFLFDCRVCNTKSDHHYVVHLVDDVIKSLEIDRHSFVLLLSDAARYMTAAGSLLKVLYPEMLHVTCVAHLFHNCAQKVRGHFNNVDKLIASVKAAIVKNKSRKEMFRSIGLPPDTIVTRWASWLNAALYYADNLPAVRAIVDEFGGDGVLVNRAKEAVSDHDLPRDLMSISRDYKCLVEYVLKAESPAYNMVTAYRDLNSITFGDDIANIKPYLSKRILQNADLQVIATLSRSNISPAIYNLLQRCPASSASVERSFSMLKKLLAKDRPFKPDNVKNYIVMYFNNVTSC